MILKLGTGERQFVGILSKPPTFPQRHAWLFCNSYGQEAIRAAPLYRVLSERLTRSGQAVLRFDYHGCGDSSGEFGDGCFEHLVANTLEAFDALRTYAPAASYSWFGLSLGANVAVMAAARASSPPARIVLWQPVTDGEAYCGQLLATHRKELADELESEWSELARDRRAVEPSLPGNVLGADYGDRFVTQLLQLKSIPVEPVLRRGVEVRIAAGTDDDRLPAVDPAGSQLLVLRTEVDLNWMTSAARSTAVAPQEIVRFVAEVA
jgi:uncharacterized protein